MPSFQSLAEEYSLSLKEAAALLGSNEKAIQRLIYTAKLDAIRLKGESGHEFRLRPHDITTRKEELRQHIWEFDPEALRPVGQEGPARMMESLAGGTREEALETLPEVPEAPTATRTATAAPDPATTIEAASQPSNLTEIEAAVQAALAIVSRGVTDTAATDHAPSAAPAHTAQQRAIGGEIDFTAPLPETPPPSDVDWETQTREAEQSARRELVWDESGPVTEIDLDAWDREEAGDLDLNGWVEEAAADIDLDAWRQEEAGLAPPPVSSGEASGERFERGEGECAASATEAGDPVLAGTIGATVREQPAQPIPVAAPPTDAPREVVVTVSEATQNERGEPGTGPESPPNRVADAVFPRPAPVHPSVPDPPGFVEAGAGDEDDADGSAACRFRFVDYSRYKRQPSEEEVKRGNRRNGLGFATPERLRELANTLTTFFCRRNR